MEDNELKITQTNELARKITGTITATQYATISHMISKIEPTDRPDKVYSYPVKDIAKLLGVTGGNNMEVLRKSIDGLYTLYWRLSSQQKTKWYRFFDTFEIDHTTNTINLTWSKTIAEHLFELQKNFVSYRMQNILDLKGNKYAMRLYTFLRGSIGRSTEKEVSIDTDELRNILMCPKSYTWNTFDFYVLRKAVEPMTVHGNKTDILIDGYEKIKDGRTVKQIVFHIIKM